MHVRDYILIGSTARGELEKVIAKQVEAWSSQWFCGAIRKVSTVADVMGTSERLRINRQTPVMLEETDGVWCGAMIANHMRERFICELLGVPNNEVSENLNFDDQSIATRALAKAIHDLVRRLIGLGPVSQQNIESLGLSAIPAQAAQRGSGAHVIKVKLGELELTLALSGKVAKRHIGHLGKIESSTDSSESVSLGTFASAMANRGVKAEAVLGCVELSVSALVSLSVGDVIQLDKSVSEPSMLLFPGTDVTCRGFVGQCDGSRALSIVEN